MILNFAAIQEEQSKSEQNMRKRRKDAGHPECNPPPVAPPFAKGFAKVLIHINSFNLNILI